MYHTCRMQKLRNLAASRSDLKVSSQHECRSSDQISQPLTCAGPCARFITRGSKQNSLTLCTLGPGQIPIEKQDMSTTGRNVSAPTLHLGAPPNRQFIPPSRRRAPLSPATASTSNRGLFAKSDLKPNTSAKTVNIYLGKKSKANPMNPTNKKRTRTDDNIEQEPAKKQSPKKRTSVFEMPPEILLPNLDGRRISDRIFNSPSSFISPDTILSSNGVVPRPKSSLSSLRSSQSSQLSSPPRTQEIEDLTKCKFCNKELPDGFFEKPPTSLRARYGYCQRHEDAATLHSGLQKGYPKSINFDTLENRVKDLRPVVKEILNGPDESEFLANLRTRVSRRMAAQPMMRIKLFNDCQPGYYGPRGMELISEIMMKSFGMYIRNKESLMDGVNFCGGVTGFVSSVIVPEVGVRLIMDDMDVNWKEACQIMKDSVAYGNVINPNVDVISDDGGDSEEDENEKR